MTTLLYNRFTRVIIGRKRPPLTEEQELLTPTEKSTLVGKIIAADQESYKNGIDIDTNNYEIQFNIKSADKEESVMGEIDVFNLSDSILAKIGESSPITLESGYEGFHSTIFVGRVLKRISTRDGSDIRTRFYCTDATQELLRSKTNFVFKRMSNITYSDAIRNLLLASNVSIGYIHPTTAVIYEGSITGAYGVRNNESILDAVKRIASTINYVIYVRNGRVYAMPEGSGFYFSGFKLTAQSGLLELRLEDSENDEYDYEVTSFILPFVGQDTVFMIESSYPKVKGAFRVKAYEYVSDDSNHILKTKVQNMTDWNLGYITNISPIIDTGGNYIFVPKEVELTDFRGADI